MPEEGYLLIHTELGPLGRVIETYEVNGDGPIIVPYITMLKNRVPWKIGERFSLGGLKLRVVDFSPELSSVSVVRDDLGFWWPFLQIKIDRFLINLKTRLILTAAIWGLAPWQEAVYAEWSTIHPISKLKKLWEKYLFLINGV